MIIISIFSVLNLNAQNKKWTDEELRLHPHFLDMIQEDNVNFYDAKEAYDLYFQNHKKEKGTGYKQFERWVWLVEGTIDNEGNLPSPDKVKNAYYRYKKTIKERGPATNDGDWQEVGPKSYPANNTGQVNGTGRVNAIAFDPANNNIIWAGAPNGGLWKTTDGGQTYSCNTDQLPTLGVSSILINPDNSDIMYIGTGDRDGGNSSGLGVYKSTDGGISWTQFNNGMGNKTVGMMVIHPTNRNILIAATSGGIYKTTDGASNWVHVSSNNDNYKDIKYHPNDPDYVYATANGEFYRSTDGGGTWTMITSGLVACNRMVIGVSADESNSVLCLLAGGSQTFQGIFKSTDKGLNFTRITPVDHPNILGYNDGDDKSQAGYDLCMIVDPTDIDHILVGSINIHESEDGGVNFTKKTHWSTEVHADQHSLWQNSLDDRIYIGNDGGLYYSDDWFDTWTQISDGLNIAQAYRIGQAAYKRELVINGYQDNGSANYKDGDFTTVLGGDGMESAFDYDDATYAYSTYIDQIKRSTNGGYGSWSTIAGNGINGIDESGAWVTPYMLHHTDPNTMFFGYKNIWRSNNVRNDPPTWTKISDNLGGSNSSNYQAIAQSPANNDIFYGARKDNKLFRSDNVNDATPSWTDLTSKLPNSGWIDDVICHPTDPEIVYLIQSDKVFKSIDKGNSWTDISGTIPSGTDLQCFVYDKNTDEGIYVGTKTGVFYKDASMSDWIPYDGNLPVVSITELEIYYGYTDSKIRAATFGRGLWESSIHQDENLTPVANFQVSNTVIYVGDTIHFEDMSSNHPTSWTWTISPSTFTYVNGTNANSQNPDIKFTSSGVYDVSLQATNANGSDTKTINSYINVLSVVSPSCTPATQNLGNYGMGIYHVVLGSIDKHSGQPHQDNPNPPEGYLDLINTDYTVLKSNTDYELLVELGTGYSEYWNVYIDYNNDGDFDDTGEEVYVAPAKVTGEQTITITTPSAPLYNQLLRMRVICDYYSISGPCDNPGYGQAEDYGIIFKDLPELSTTVVTNIDYSSAQSGGNITSQGSSSVSNRGIVWGIFPNPTLEINWGFTDEGTGTGSYTSQMTGLDPNTHYYVRAYAINDDGISYGQQESFTTLTASPTLSTDDISNISYYSATSGGNITDDKGRAITSRGIVWDTVPNPSYSKNVGFTSDGTGTGAFVSNMSQLFPNTTYYVRAYARNNYSISYGDEKTFTTLPPDPNQSKDLVFSDITTDKIGVSWTNGTGTNRVVKINTENSFTPPADGTDPPANTTYGGGEQVIYNGPGNTVVEVTNLEPSTIYYFIVYDYTGSGSNTVYNTAPGINNPKSQITYCQPDYTNGDVGTHIKRFILNQIDNSSGASHYSDYTDISTPVLPDSIYDVSFEMSYNQERVSIWIDWNDNQEFEAGEKLLSDFLCPANALTTTQITMPTSTNFGNHIIRVRASWYSGAGPCSTETYGETEDYTVDFKDKFTWDGSTSTDWFDATNWDVGKIPSLNYEVIIPNTSNQPNIGTGQTANAKKITAESGAGLIINGILNLIN